MATNPSSTRCILFSKNSDTKAAQSPPVVTRLYDMWCKSLLICRMLIVIFERRLCIRSICHRAMKRIMVAGIALEEKVYSEYYLMSLSGRIGLDYASDT